jgi:hypothetical protein
MGIETLQSAVRAAGFAMAAEDDGGQACEPQKMERAEWRPAEAKLLALTEQDQPGRLADTLKGVLGFFGRRASPA